MTQCAIVLAQGGRRVGASMRTFLMLLVAASFSIGQASAVLGEVMSAVCGNQMLEGDEGCDDGNTFGGDGCAANCSVEEQHLCAVGSGSTLTMQTGI